MSVFLDTSVLFSFLSRRDTRHAEASRLLRDVAKGEHGAPFTSTFVADELLTLARARGRDPVMERAARDLLPLPEPAIGSLRMLHVDLPVMQASLARFERHRARGLSFTDATHLTLMASFGIETLATFDSGFHGLVSVVPEEP